MVCAIVGVFCNPPFTNSLFEATTTSTPFEVWYVTLSVCNGLELPPYVKATVSHSFKGMQPPAQEYLSPVHIALFAVSISFAHSRPSK
jgi:hypothetical protein